VKSCHIDGRTDTHSGPERLLQRSLMLELDDVLELQNPDSLAMHDKEICCAKQ
jgi:hypothetical protein